MKKKADYAKVAKREKYFSTLASKEAKSNEKVLKHEVKAHQPEAAKDTRWEIKVDKKFAAIRKKLADKAKKQAK